MLRGTEGGSAGCIWSDWAAVLHCSLPMSPLASGLNVSCLLCLSALGSPDCDNSQSNIGTVLRAWNSHRLPLDQRVGPRQSFLIQSHTEIFSPKGGLRTDSYARFWRLREWIPLKVDGGR